MAFHAYKACRHNNNPMNKVKTLHGTIFVYACAVLCEMKKNLTTSSPKGRTEVRLSYSGQALPADIDTGFYGFYTKVTCMY